MAYSIRLYEDADADHLGPIRRAAIAVIGPRAYTERQVAAWISRVDFAADYRERVSQGAIIFVVAGGDDIPFAYALLEPNGHLDHLYNHPEHTRDGLAGRLLLRVEDHASLVGIERLYTEASELARPVFARVGYEELHRRDVVIDGVSLHNYAMEKRLD